MRDLYNEFKEMLIENQKSVMGKKADFNREVKTLTKEAREYRLQLNEYGKEIERNIKAINKKIKNFKEEA